MTSAADKIRENALRVKGNNESRRAQPAQAKPMAEVESLEARRDPASSADLSRGERTQSLEDRIEPETGSKNVQPPARPQRARKSQSSSGTPMFAPRQTPVRRTVDLTPAAHSKLDDWQRKTAREIGVARVTGQEVLATLVDEFLENPELAAVIRDSIWHRRQ